MSANLDADTAAKTGQAAPALSVVDAITGRRSIRRFLPDPVPEQVIRDILAAAARAPSGTNSQPWFVHVVTGTARQCLCDAVVESADADNTTPEYCPNPRPWWEPFITRRRKVGFDLYALYGIAREDMAARKEARLRNFRLFGAPVGLFFTMERSLLHGSWLDCGMFMANVMAVARAYGLETCAQQAWCDYGAVLRQQLGIPDNHIILSGMALGRADPAAPENSLMTEREPVDRFCKFHSR